MTAAAPAPELAALHEPALRAGAEPSALARAANSWMSLTVVCVGVWALARCIFFVGYEGSDDMFYLRFAALWHRAPVNHWEARLLGNALLRACISLFGISQASAALPALGASLAVLTSTLLVCKWFGGIRQAWWAGLLIALLPIEITNATTVSAHAVMVGFMAVGTLAFLRAADSRAYRLLAAVFLPMGVVAHYNGIYYVASLTLAALCIEPRRQLRPVVTIFFGGLLIMLGELLAFHLLFGDALCGLKVSSPENIDLCEAESLTSLSWPMVAWSLQQLAAGKPFGIALLITALGTGLCCRRLATPVRILALSALLFWLVLSFGSYVPWDYRPFWRNARYLHPLAMPVAVLFGLAVVQLPFRPIARLLGITSLAACVAVMGLTGSWGQNVRISRELLDYARAHPDMLFVTDVHTANEIYTLNGLHMPANVAGTADFGRTHYLAADVQLIAERDLADRDAILVNPFNLERTPTFANMVEPRLVTLVHQTRAAYRPACVLLPSLRNQPWAVRKPPAKVYRLKVIEE